MNELRIKIKPSSRKKYRITNSIMNFEELERLIRLSMLREKMEKLSSVSKKVGLAKTSSKEIDTIVKITRQRAKNSR